MYREVALQVGFSVMERHAVLLDQGVNLDPGLKAKEAPNLALRQRAGVIGVDCERLEGLPRDVLPPTLN